jgi:hypothetical protein
MICLKVMSKLLEGHQHDIQYLLQFCVFFLDKLSTSETKYTSACLFTWSSCLSCTSVAPGEAATYRSSGVPDESGVRVVKSIRYCFNSSKAFY